MKNILISFLVFMGLSPVMQSQCNVYVAMYQLPVSCAGDSLFFMGNATSSCQYGGTYHYTWTAYAGADSVGSSAVSSLSGIAISGTLIESFAIPSATAGLNNICLEVVYCDTSGVPLDTAIQCLNTFNFPQPITVTGFVSNNSCGDPSCLAQYTASGGTAPYTFLLSNGAVISPGAVTCFDFSGVYVLTAMDANGCTGDFSFAISISDDDNSTCQNSILVETNNIFTDTLCSLSFDTSNCGTFNYYQQGWYHFNSDEFSHISIGADIGYGSATGGNYLQPFLIEVYENSTANTCGGNLVHCHLSDSSGGCFALESFIDIQPNTTYSLHVMAQWTSWVPMTLLISADSVSQGIICGCTNPSSCNYDPGAAVSDGSCGYNGCTDVSACNYMIYASCDDGSCVYGNDFNAMVFHDLNGDGAFQPYNPGEPIIGATGYFTLNETGQIIYPSSAGEILIPGLNSGLYTLSYTDTTNTWILLGGIISFQLPACTTVPLGLVPSSGATAQVNVFGSFWGQTIHCVGGLTPGISLCNTGAASVSGTLTLNFDPALTYSFSGGTVFTEISPGIIQWNIENQLPGSTAWYEVHFNGPGAEFVGQEFPFTMTLQLQDENDVSFYNNEWDFSGWVTCSYDPNDKTAFPVGYTNEHYISSDQVLEYKIRFQNTGNATAFNIRIEDQIDISKLDLSTFQLTGASHDYSVVVDPGGWVQFYFNNIMLPDSVNDEANSHGWLQYRIAPWADVEPGDIITNTAAIYFDDNAPVMTNEVTHTIYDCSMMLPIPSEVATCIANPVILAVDTTFTDSFVWYENGEQISIGSDFNYAFPEVGEHIVVLERFNPLCIRMDTINIQSLPYPSTDLSMSGDTIYAMDGAYWEWFFNDDLISDSVQFIVADEPGVYYAYVFSAEGCMSISEVQAVVGLQQYARDYMHLYPNPAGDYVWLDGVEGGDEVELLDGMGKRVFRYKAKQSPMRIDLQELSSGIYFLRMLHDGQELDEVKLIVK